MATKTIHAYTAATTIDGAADFLLIDPASTGTYNKINRNVLLGITSTPIGASDSQTLQNKTLDNTNAITVKDGSFTLNNTSDTTKKAVFSLSGITTGTTRTYTMPNASVTLASLTGTEVLTNKTITSPTITGGTIDNATITVDSISGHTSATQVTVGGILMNNGVIGTSSAVVAASIAVGAVQPNALTASTGTGWAWTSWSPGLVNFTIGTGGAAGTTAKYIQVGKIIFFRLVSVLGTSGQSVGSGVTFVLPTTPVSMGGSGTANMFLGLAWFEHTGVSNSQGYATISSAVGSTTVQVTVQNVAGTYATATQLSSTIPFTWAAGDSLNIEGFYETA